MAGEQGFPDFGAVGKDADHGVHAVTRDVQMSAIGGRKQNSLWGDGQRKAHYGLAGGNVVERKAAIGLAAGDELSDGSRRKRAIQGSEAA